MSDERVLDFWFDYSCPYAYLASTQVEGLAHRMRASLAWKPMLLGGVFQAVGTPQNLSETLSQAKAQHNVRTMHRWAAHYSVPFALPSGHPFRTVEALRATLVTGCDPKVIHGFYRAYWVEGRAPSEPETLRSVLSNAGHEPEVVLARMKEDAVKQDLRARTEQAISLGIFGAPSFWWKGELFWGQDRMALLEHDYFAPKDSARSAKPHTLTCYFDFSSPYAYLGISQLDALLERTGAVVEVKPMLLGGLFKLVGQADVPLFTWSAAKQQHTHADLHRWARYWGVPFQFPSRFPMNSLKALRTYLALPEERRSKFLHATFRAYWAEDRDLTDEAVLRELVGENADEVLVRSTTPEVKQALLAATQSAAAAGVFGAPTFVVDGSELFWGQDQLDLVEAALRR